ncbi:MAG: hypothetical protein LDL31_12185 [Prosthecobacter sp.]|nr:hypothetical protein [Prosthecobacter sp.]
MKSRLLQARFRAPKASACAMCKPHKRGWLDKKTLRDVRLAARDEQQLREL